MPDGGEGPRRGSLYGGPASDIQLTPQHDRAILSMDLSVQGDRVVTASADHGLRLYNVESGEQIRQLFNQEYGHHDWVTTCAFLEDGRILSGGNDTRLCLWDAEEAKCVELTGHNGNISKVQVEGEVALTAGYDAQLLLWNLSEGLTECANGLLGGHRDAVMDFAWSNSLAVSGDRAGILAFWDVNRSEPVRVAKGHGSAVGKVCFYSDD